LLFAGFFLWKPSGAFEPSITAVGLDAETVQPGTGLAYWVRFENRGQGAAERELVLFAHVEPDEERCKRILCQLDHALTTSAQLWDTGAVVTEGPLVVPVPKDVPEGTWRLHVGLYDPQSGRRFAEDRSRRVWVAAQAPAARPRAFEPELTSVELHAGAVRPGAELSYVLRFENRGTLPAERGLTTFFHIEREGVGCQGLLFQRDCEPFISTRRWRGGATIVEGPYSVRVPRDADEGTWIVHAGLFDRKGGGCVVDDRSRRLTIDSDAPSALGWIPRPLEPSEIERRGRNARREPLCAARIDGDGWSFAVAQDGRSWRLVDEAGGVVWSSGAVSAPGSSGGRGRVALAMVAGRNGTEPVPLERFTEIRRVGNSIFAEAEVELEPGVDRASVIVSARLVEDGRALRLSWSAEGDKGRIVAVRLLDRAFLAADTEGGMLALPYCLGELLPASRRLPRDERYRDRDLTLSMCGVLKSGAALLASWSDLGTELTTHFELVDSQDVPGRRTCSLSVDVPDTGGWVELRPLGRGDHVEIGRAYREVATGRGLRATWQDKKAEEPQIERLEGAPIFRFTALMRFASGTRHNPSDRERTRRAYRFEDIAACAEHWRETLELDRAHVIVAGWGREGYDRGHPDVFPANPQCGGDGDLRDCSRRVSEQGYQFTLHENLHDHYPDAPSFDERVLRRDERGDPYPGGEWTGGGAWRVCPLEQLRFGRRNLAEIERRYAPGALYLDSTLTLPLSGCSDARHPLTPAQDLAARKELYALARSTFGVLGLEGAQEWAVADAHWFENPLTHKTVHDPKRIVVPLFPLVFGDCVLIVPTQNDRVDIDDARKVLDLALYGQMPCFELAPRTYFRAAQRSVPVRVKIVDYKRHGPGRFTLTLDWNVYGPMPSEPLDLFVHFVRDRSPHLEGVDAQAAPQPDRPTSTWREGERVSAETGPIELPLGDDAVWEVQVGTHRGGIRYGLEGLAGSDGRTTIARIRCERGVLTLEPPEWTARADCFARADGGWARGLHASDRLIKNTFELLSPLHRLIVGCPMTDHRFLGANRSVEQTEYGDVRVTVNYGPGDHHAGSAVLPPFGVLIESPTFVGFHATRYAGVDYPGGALFTVRSLDGEPLASSELARVYHGFGPTRIAFANKEHDVERERVLARAGPGFASSR